MNGFENNSELERFIQIEKLVQEKGIDIKCEHCNNEYFITNIKLKKIPKSTIQIPGEPYIKEDMIIPMPVYVCSNCKKEIDVNKYLNFEKYN